MVTLDEAIERADLPGLIANYYPDSGSCEGKSGLYQAVWRGDEKASLSVFRHKGTWFYRDHATGDKGTAWHFLTKVVGLSKRDALEVLGVNGEGAKSQEEILAEAQVLLRHNGLPRVLSKRGFTFDEALKLGFGVMGDSVMIPVRGPYGELLAVKVRRSGEPKYCYLRKQSKAASWHSDNFSSGMPVVVVEGELNAMIANCVDPELAFVGVAGAENSPDWASLIGRKVYLAADDDEAGRKALKRWQKEAEHYGICPLPLKPLKDDYCEMGREQLKQHLASLKIARYCERIMRHGELEELKAMSLIGVHKLLLSNDGGGIYRVMIWSRDCGW